MHRILSVTAMLYLHCESTMGAYLKLVLEAVFGREGRQRMAMPRRSNGYGTSDSEGTGDGLADSDLATLAGDPGRDALVTRYLGGVCDNPATVGRGSGGYLGGDPVERRAVLLQPGNATGQVRWGRRRC